MDGVSCGLHVIRNAEIMMILRTAEKVPKGAQVSKYHFLRCGLGAEMLFIECKDNAIRVRSNIPP